MHNADELLRRYLKHAPNIAQMLNVLEQDWKRDNCWSEWDQATMNEQRAIHAAVDAYLNEKPQTAGAAEAQPKQEPSATPAPPHAEPERDALQKLSVYEREQLEFYRNATAEPVGQPTEALDELVSAYGNAMHFQGEDGDEDASLADDSAKARNQLIDAIRALLASPAAQPIAPPREPTYTEMVEARDTLNLRIAEIELLHSFGKP